MRRRILLTGREERNIIKDILKQKFIKHEIVTLLN